MNKTNKLEQELKTLIIKTLDLEDITEADFSSEDELFGDNGIGLDSIDALELGVAIKKTYQVSIKGESEENLKQYFMSVKSLAEFINNNIN